MSHQVWSDVKKNCLYLKISSLELARTEEFKEKILKEVAKLKKGFKCIGDFRETRADFELLPSDIVETYKNFIQQLVKEGMQEIVRIVNPEIYLLTMIIQTDIQLGISVPYVDSMERAEFFLNGKKR